MFVHFTAFCLGGPFFPGHGVDVVLDVNVMFLKTFIGCIMYMLMTCFSSLSLSVVYKNIQSNSVQIIYFRRHGPYKEKPDDRQTD